jgi:hypothetical protein
MPRAFVVEADSCGRWLTVWPTEGRILVSISDLEPPVQLGISLSIEDWNQLVQAAAQWNPKPAKVAKKQPAKVGA